MSSANTDRPNSLPVELLRFINSHIQSVEQLEILCLLVEHPSRTWGVEEVLGQIQSTRKSVLASLQHLANHQLLTGDPQSGFRFQSGAAELAEWACRLAEAYRQRRVTVIGSIYQKPASV